MEELSDRQPGEHREPLPGDKRAPGPLIAGRYEMVHKLEGGMAHVYLCRDHKTNQPVALKTFKPEYLSHRAARDLFLREGTMWVELGHHPHIVRAYRVERVGDGSEVYMVLEWVVQPQGKNTPSLRSWLKPGQPLPLEQALLFSLHVARGMKYATSKIHGLVHRDLKPENVLVGHDGQARVTDFGLASTLSNLNIKAIETQTQTRENFARTQLTHGVVGTPLYMPPEQWARQSLDARADIYALGCILYEMITGRFAAEGENRDELREIHLTGRIKPPPPSTPRAVVLFLRKCLAANRDHRYWDWAEVEEALAEVYWHVVGEEPPPERAAAGETRAERLAAGQSYNSMGLSYLDIGKLNVAVMYFEQAVWIGRAEKSVELEGAGLGNLGLAYTALGYSERAIEFHEEHLAIARETGDQAEEGRALGNLGRAYRQLGDTERATRFHQRELALAQKLGNRYKEAAALDSIGDTYRQSGDVSQGVSFYKRSLAIARDIGDQARVRSILGSMGRIYLDAGETKEAVALFHQSLDIARKIGDRVGEGEALSNLGDLYHTLGYAQRAIEFNRHALTIFQESHDLRREVRCLIDLGDLYLELEDADEARGYFEDALVAAQEIGDQIREMRIFGKLGDAHSALGDYMQAASLYKRSLKLAREMGDQSTEQRVLIALGRAYEQWGDLGRMIKYFGQHLAISREKGKRPDVITMLDTLGGLYHRMNQLRLAEETYAEYLALVREDGDRAAEGDALNKLGAVARDRSKARAAVELYKEALAIAREGGDRVAEAAVLSNLGVVYNDSNDLRKKWQATRHCDKALKIAEETGEDESIAWASYKLALVLFRQERWDKARPHAERAEQLFAQLGDGDMSGRLQKMLAEIRRQKSTSTGFFAALTGDE